MQVDWDSSHEAVDLDEAIRQDSRLLNDLKELEEQPTVTSQLSRYVQQTQSMFDDCAMGDEGEKKSAATRMMFFDSDIDELLNQPVGENSLHILYDKTLCEKVWNRANYLRKLKTRLVHVALECHHIEEITAYIKACKAQTNYDLSHEAQVAKEKLCLMQDALKIGQINNQQD